MKQLPTIWTGNTTSEPCLDQPSWCTMQVYFDLATRPALEPLFDQAAVRCLKGFRMLGPVHEHRLVWTFVVFGIERKEVKRRQEAVAQFRAMWQRHPELAELEQPRQPWWSFWLVDGGLRPYLCQLRLEAAQAGYAFDELHLTGIDVRTSPEIRSLVEGRIDPQQPRHGELVLQAGHVTHVAAPDQLEWALAEQRRVAAQGEPTAGG